MNKNFLRIIALVFLGFLNHKASAIVTAYATFDHPEGWRCELSQGVWICQSTREPERKESVVLSIATMATEWDTLDHYEQYLKQTRIIQDEQGHSLTSKVTYVRKRNINGTNWVDSLQHNSELPGFWSRYVATVHNKLAILITYIVSDEQYSKMAPEFERMVSSLKPNAEFDLNIASKQGEPPLPGATKIGALQKSILSERLNVKKAATPNENAREVSSEDGNYANYIIMVVGLIAIYLVFFRKRKPKRTI
jgi:hypothetical protein